MIKTFELSCSCDMSVRIDTAHSTKHIRKLLVVQLAILVFIDEVIDVEQFIWLDSDIGSLQGCHELMKRDEPVIVLIGQSEIADDTRPASHEGLFHAHQTLVENSYLL